MTAAGWVTPGGAGAVHCGGGDGVVHVGAVVAGALATVVPMRMGLSAFRALEF